MARALGIETATSIASVGILDGDRVAAECALPMRGSHARTLLPLIDGALSAAGISLADLDLLAVSIGPGSFTGLRIGLSVVKGLALASSLPVVAVPTLDAYARTAGPRAGLVCPVLDARKGEVYAAVFRWHGEQLERVVEPAALEPARFAAELTRRPSTGSKRTETSVPCTLIGDGVDAYTDLWRRTLGASADLVAFATLPPSGATVARMGIAGAAAATDDLSALEPTYCRPSEAELGRPRSSRSAAGSRVAQVGVEKLTGGRG